MLIFSEVSNKHLRMLYDLFLFEKICDNYLLLLLLIIIVFYIKFRKVTIYNSYINRQDNGVLEYTN